MRIFKAVLAALLVVVFIALLASAYHRYHLTLSIVGLIDTTSSLTNQLVLDTLAHEEGEAIQGYVIDPEKITSLDFRQEVAGENFEFQLTLRYGTGAQQVFGPYGPAPPEGTAVATLSVPVVVYENNRLEPAKLEVKTWRA